MEAAVLKAGEESVSVDMMLAEGWRGNFQESFKAAEAARDALDAEIERVRTYIDNAAD